MMVFRDLSIWYFDNYFIKMPQNRKYPSGAEKRRKKEQDKADEKCKGFLDRFVVVEHFHQKIGNMQLLHQEPHSIF